MIEELEHENRLLRARNERVEQERDHALAQYREMLTVNGGLIRDRNELLAFAEEVRRTGDTRLASMAIATIANVKG